MMTNTASQMSEAIGTNVSVAFKGSVTVDCIVRDVKTSYGTVRYLIEPQAGTGRAWVDAVPTKTITNGKVK